MADPLVLNDQELSAEDWGTFTVELADCTVTGVRERPAMGIDLRPTGREPARPITNEEAAFWVNAVCVRDTEDRDG
ncbi:hypothetical protein ACFV1C_00575 [Streptomyces sp. NPDC059605]|uniref:hypothetical protein n=1 Tax=Streptomyces sp. NPDC059605 TaxID=3346882 RepID=UPI0036D0A482